MTYNQLVQIINDFAQGHFQINKFEEGFVDDINPFLTKNQYFPAMYMNTISVRELLMDDSVSGVSSFEIEFYFLDLLKNNDNNLREVMSDQLSIARDFINWLRQGDNGLNLLEEPSLRPIKSIDLDYSAGWVTSLLIEVAVERSDCSIPRCE